MKNIGRTNEARNPIDEITTEQREAAERFSLALLGIFKSFTIANAIAERMVAHVEANDVTMGLLAKAERPFQFSAGRDGFFESEAFAAFEASLRLLQNPCDVLARRSLVRQGTGPSLESAAADPGNLASLIGRLPGWRKEAMQPLLSAQADASTLGNAIGEVVRRARAATFADEEERAAALADADALEKRWACFRQVDGADATVARFLGDIALAGRGGIDGAGVRVLTIHAAKGLEFRAVIMVGMNDGSFPDYRSKTVEEIADERRNAYVAITRAERALFLSRPRSRLMPWGDPRAQQVSRFLAEAGIAVREVL